MSITKRWMPALAAVVLATGLSSAALADDFADACKAGGNNDKDCGCMAEKAAAGDKPAMTAAMKKMTELGDKLDASVATLPPDTVNGIKLVFETMAKCLQ